MNAPNGDRPNAFPSPHAKTDDDDVDALRVSSSATVAAGGALVGGCGAIVLGVNGATSFLGPVRWLFVLEIALGVGMLVGAQGLRRMRIFGVALVVTAGPVIVIWNFVWALMTSLFAFIAPLPLFFMAAAVVGVVAALASVGEVMRATDARARLAAAGFEAGF